MVLPSKLKNPVKTKTDVMVEKPDQGIVYTESEAEDLSKNLSGIDASIAQISAASAQLEIPAYKMRTVVMVVEQAMPEAEDLVVPDYMLPPAIPGDHIEIQS
jgi:hypothetical protein